MICRWVKLTQKQTGNEIWLQPEFGELPLDRWLWRVASCRSDVFFVTCFISFFCLRCFLYCLRCFLWYLWCFVCHLGSIIVTWDVFLSRDFFFVVCGIFLVACNILIFVVNVFFVVTTPSSRFEIHLGAKGQEVDVEGYTAHCANAWRLIRIMVFFFFLGMNSPTLCLVMDIMASVHRAEKLALANSTNFNLWSIPTNIIIDELIIKIEKLPQR